MYLLHRGEEVEAVTANLKMEGDDGSLRQALKLKLDSRELRDFPVGTPILSDVLLLALAMLTAYANSFSKVHPTLVKSFIIPT